MIEERPKRGRPGNPERLEMIGDAIIAVLADSGSRGLTHRAVDLQAGLPAGTAVYHAPTRVDLLVLASQRLTELGLRELGWLRELIDHGDRLVPEQVIDRQMTVWRERLRTDRRERARAEIAVALASSRDPVINDAYKAPQAFIGIWTRVMERLGAISPAAAAAEYTGVIRGRFYHHVLSAASLDDDRALRASLLAVLRALVALDLRPTPPAPPQPAPRETVRAP